MFDPLPSALVAAALLEAPPLLEVDDWRTNLTVDHVRQILGTTIVTNFGARKRLSELCNFAAEDVFKAFKFNGLASAEAWEQGGKCYFMVALAAVARACKRPVMLVVAEKHSNVKGVSLKMECVLEVFGVKTRFMNNGGKVWERLQKSKDSKHDLANLRSGKLLLVTPGYAAARIAVLREEGVTDALLLVDECDSLTRCDSVAKMRDNERQLFDVTLAAMHAAPGESITISTVTFVSATHLASIKWSQELEHGRSTLVSADVELLRQRGYTSPDDLELFCPADPGNVGQDTYYGITTVAGQRLIRDFRECPGQRKLMVITSCPYVNAGAATLHTQAEQVLLQDPEGVVVVTCPGGAWLYLQHPQVPGETVGKKIVVRGAGGRRAAPVNTPDQALALVEQRYGAAGDVLRFYAIGYRTQLRSMSTRTTRRVPTHMYVVPTKGVDTAETKQAIMRCGGDTVNARLVNGFTKVKVVCRQDDFDMVRELTGFTMHVFAEREAHPEIGVEDVRHSFSGVSNAGRRHAPPKMNIMVREAEPLARAEAGNVWDFDKRHPSWGVDEYEQEEQQDGQQDEQQDEQDKQQEAADEVALAFTLNGRLEKMTQSAACMLAIRTLLEGAPAGTTQVRRQDVLHVLRENGRRDLSDRDNGKDQFANLCKKYGYLSKVSPAPGVWTVTDIGFEYMRDL